MIDNNLHKKLDESLKRLSKLERESNVRIWIISAVLVLYVASAIYIHFVK